MMWRYMIDDVTVVEMGAHQSFVNLIKCLKRKEFREIF